MFKDILALTFVLMIPLTLLVLGYMFVATFWPFVLGSFVLSTGIVLFDKYWK